MISKIGLILAAGAATAALTVALAAAGFAPGSPTTTAPVTPVVGKVPETAPVADPTIQPQVVYDDVYVRPAPPPQTVVVKVTKPGAEGQEGAENESENEGSDD